MNENFNITEHPHRRLNLLTGEWILVSPHRSKRPWQGKQETIARERRATHDPNCYLCAGNKRADGTQNPNYESVFVFINDFSALLEESPSGKSNEQNLLVAESQSGICKVISFSPRHDLTLAEMSVETIGDVVDVWQQEFIELAKNPSIRYIQIFENKGDTMGCSNPHPHGQIWASSELPNEIYKESIEQKKYFDQHGRSLLYDYATLELEKKERIVAENEHFVVLVPFWATWPYETIVISKRHVQDISLFTAAEKTALAAILKDLLVRYDNLFEVSFPYSGGMHQQPVNDGFHEFWHWHMHFYPPLLRSATVKKFMVGYEMLANPQRDITAEGAAESLRNVSTKHYLL
jgi:UDPglucose--hexose-1-phosphate uridylyltransferase